MISPRTGPYGDYERREMMQYLPSGARRILDVGCGGGAFGAYLKSQCAKVEVFGVEPDVEAADRASLRLDSVQVGLFPSVQPPGPFDVVFFNDVLEHMIDPEPALRAAHQLSRYCGRITSECSSRRRDS